MVAIAERNTTSLKEVDVIKDREYILSELKKSEFEKSYSLEESYKKNLARLYNLTKNHENI